MSRPWKKQWPRVGRNGKKSYTVGFYDHDKVERSKSFASASGEGGARDWMRDYSAAERRGAASLERFLRDLDAKDANATDGRPFGLIVAMYFALDADPKLEGGLAQATFHGYKWTANAHILGRPMHNQKHQVIGRKSYATWLAARPASEFNEPHTPRQFRDMMRADGQGQARIKDTWKVLSAVLSWAAGSHEVPEIHTNGCILANERTSNRRRSVRAGSTGKSTKGRKRRSKTQAWALSPQAVEAIRAQQRARLGSSGNGARDPILAKRDAIVTSLMYGLAARPQEIWGMRWCCIHETFAEVEEVISWGELDEYGKTSSSTERRPRMPRLLYSDLLEWRLDLHEWGHPAAELDFIIPGDLGGKRWGVIDPDTGACHLSLNQCKKWGGRYFNPAVKKAAAQPALAAILGATPYSLRRGGISLRLRAEDPQTVAAECGTSNRMLDEHYRFAIDDLRRFGPRPFNEEWEAARNARESAEQDTGAQPAQESAASREGVLVAA